MNLYSVDDRFEGADSTEINSSLFWAFDAEQACQLYRRWCPEAEWYEVPLTWFLVQRTGFTPAHEWPHRECRREVYREARYWEAGERACEACDLYPMGLAQFALCQECRTCRSCGCRCGGAGS